MLPGLRSERLCSERLNPHGDIVVLVLSDGRPLELHRIAGFEGPVAARLLDNREMSETFLPVRKNKFPPTFLGFPEGNSRRDSS